MSIRDVPSGQGDRLVDSNRRAAVVVELASGQHVTLPASYLEESTSLGYALTVFRSQGVTVDHSFLLGNDTLFQEAGYTALSRGRLSNHLFAVAPENSRGEIAHGDEIAPHRDALGGLVESLSHSHEQTMALESLPAYTSDGERAPSQSMGEPAVASVEAWFQNFARDLARMEQRANEPPTPDRALGRSRHRDRGYDRSYDSGFGL